MLGMKVMETYTMVEQKLIKKPRKKSNRRWQKKYMKKYSITVQRRDVLISQTDGIIICHPVVAREIKQQISNKAFHRDTQSRDGLGFSQHF